MVSFSFFSFYFILFTVARVNVSWLHQWVAVRGAGSDTGRVGLSHGFRHYRRHMDLRAKFHRNRYWCVNSRVWSIGHKIFGEKSNGADEENRGGGEMNGTARMRRCVSLLARKSRQKLACGSACKAFWIDTSGDGRAGFDDWNDSWHTVNRGF